LIKIKNKGEIAKMKAAGKVLARIFGLLEEKIAPGVSTMELNELVEETIRAAGMSPTFKGYGGFPAAACVSVGEEVVHGIPDSGRLLTPGEIVSVDIGATNDGYVADACRTFFVGSESEIAADARRLALVAERCFFAGLKHCHAGEKIGDISAAIQKVAEAAGFGVIREFVGHGIGSDMHEDPKIPNYGMAGTGPKLLPGMALAIEPMITMGGYEIEILGDGWTAVTKDGSLAAHYENTVIITDGEPVIITA
jgi:methionyl aminopeptidase